MRHAIIIGVRANPNPSDGVAGQFSDRAMVIAHTNGVEMIPALQGTETELQMVGIPMPKAIILNCQLLNFCRECLE